MALTATDLVNRAIQYIGNDQAPVTGTLPNFDTSPAGVAAAKLYPGVVQTISDQFGWDFSRNTATLTASGNTPPPQWTFEYLYPTNGIEVRQLMPATVNNNIPLPIRWTVGNVLVSAVPTKVIWSNLASAKAIFTNQPPEALWDSGFTEAVVRLLASEMAMAIAGRPETSKNMLESAQAFGQAATLRDG